MHYTPYKHYKIRTERKKWYSEYPLEKCKYSIFYHRLLLGYSYEDAINPNRLSKFGRVDRKAVVEKIQSKVGKYNNWYAVITQHKEVLKQKEKTDFVNIVHNKQEAQVIIDEYKRILYELDNTECLTNKEQNELIKKQTQIKSELDTFISYANTLCEH